MNGFKKLMLGMAAILVFPALAIAGGGSGTEGGGYMDFNGKKILKAALRDLESKLPALDAPELRADPERRAVILNALERLEVRSQENRRRNGQKLVMDFDRYQRLIFALMPFFEGFQTTAVSTESIKSAEQLLLHEVAHLWGDDDEEAHRFATGMLLALHPVSSGKDDPRCPKGQVWVELKASGRSDHEVSGSLYRHEMRFEAEDIETPIDEAKVETRLRSGWTAPFCLPSGKFRYRFDFSQLRGDFYGDPLQISAHVNGRLMAEMIADPGIIHRGFLLRFSVERP